MDRNITPIDTRHEAIKAMAKALSDMGYTRDVDPDDVSPGDAMYAVRAMIRRYAELDDMSSCFEFLTEGSPGTDQGIITKLTDAMDGDSSLNAALGSCMCTRARWYGEGFLTEALDMLDSADEVARDRHIDQQIKQRKEMT